MTPVTVLLVRIAPQVLDLARIIKEAADGPIRTCPTKTTEEIEARRHRLKGQQEELLEQLKDLDR